MSPLQGFNFINADSQGGATLALCYNITPFQGYGLMDALRAYGIPACAGMTGMGGNDGFCGFCGLIVLMSADTTAVAEGQAQNAGGDAAPVFVENLKDYLRHVLSVHAPACGKWMGHAHYFVFFAAVYALACIFAGWLFPQVYQSWLGWLAPLTEFVGGMTPRAERITGELIANGYPERADDAVHGIAMARVFVVPVVICMLMVVANAAKMPPLVVSCSHRWRRGALPLIYTAIPFLALAIYYKEFIGGENFGVGTVRSAFFLHLYHRGDFAILMEVLITLGLFLVGMLFMALILMMRATSFNIIAQQPNKL